jgi:hypothetical protein
MAAYKMAAFKITPPNDFPLGLIRSHMVVIHLPHAWHRRIPQMLVRDLRPTLYFLLWTVLAGHESVNQKCFCLLLFLALRRCGCGIRFSGLQSSVISEKKGRFVCLFLFCLSLCLLLITCGGRKRKLNLRYSFKHTKHVT